MTNRARQLAAFSYRLYWSSNFPFERLTTETQAKHLAMAEDVLNFMRANGWIKEEQG